MIAEQTVKDAEQERAAATGYVSEAELGNLGRSFARNHPTDGVLNYVADDVFRRVINAASLADFGLFLDAGALVGGDDDLAKEAFVNAAEDVNRNRVEVVDRIEMTELSADVGKGVIVNLRLVIEPLVVLVNSAIVNFVEAAGFSEEILPRGTLGTEVGDPVLRLDMFVFQETEKDEAVEGALGEFGQRFAIKVGIPVLKSAG
ncbi:hypothetical protein LBMAG56_47690 [Verrucomicrobiota bacterium]|nr:hypothetical protein LBMAG56_47690 [Verrucomicrobiota bacterium]